MSFSISPTIAGRTATQKTLTPHTSIRFGVMSNELMLIARAGLGQLIKPGSTDEIKQLSLQSVTQYITDQVNLHGFEKLEALQGKAAFGVSTGRQEAQQSLDLIKENPVILAQEVTRALRGKPHFKAAEERLWKLAENASPEDVTNTLNFFYDSRFYVPTGTLIETYSKRPNGGNLNF